jgi:hypothetical protein
MPRAVTGAEASEATLPPDRAVNCVIILTAVVVNEGGKVTGGTWTGLDFLQENNPIARKAGTKNMPLRKEIKDTLRMGVAFFMSVVFELRS